MNSTNSSITWLTLRVRVHVPGGHKLPDRVRVIVKERGALFFPYQRKLMSIPLYKVGWRPLEGKALFNEQAMAVPVKMGKLLRRAERQRLALQLYCLRGSTVQHKAVGGFARLMQEVHEDELRLSLHYPGYALGQHAVLVPRGEDHKAVPCNPSPASTAPVAGDLQQNCGVPATTNDDVKEDAATTNDVVKEDVSSCLERAPPLPIEPSHSPPQDVSSCLERAPPLPIEPSHSPPRRVRFPDSGSVFVELLREYEVLVAREQEAAKKASEEKAAAAAAVRKKANKQLTYSRWRRRLHALGIVAALFLVSALVAHLMLPQQELQLGRARIRVVLMLLVSLGYCCSRLARRRRTNPPDCREH